MFNLQGSEIIVILLIALVVLGPDRLPDAVRRFMQTYNELKKMGSGFQAEIKSAFDEPMREMRDTVNTIRDAADPTKLVAEAEAENRVKADANSAAAEPVAAEPVTAEPIVAEPVTAEPIVAEPFTAEPIDSEPVTAEPVTTEPVDSEPAINESASAPAPPPPPPRPPARRTSTNGSVRGEPVAERTGPTSP